MPIERGTEYRGTKQSDSRNATDELLANGLGWFSIGLGAAELLAPGAVAALIGVREDERTRGVLRGYGLREIATGIGILTQPNPGPWLWGRVGGDLLDLASLGAAYSSPDNDDAKLTFATTSVVGVTALDIYAAQQLSRKSSNGRSLVNNRELPAIETIIVNRSAEEVYRFWRNFQNLPTFMNHLESVQVLDDRRSQWRAKAPAGTTVEWDAELIEDRPNELIAWRSVEGSTVENSGFVRFERAPGGRGTLIHVELRYSPPAGALGAAVAKLFGEEPRQQLYDDLRAFKQIMEIGEVVKSDASIHPGMHPAQPPAR
jgi:uncharacterized membrane protein